MMLQVIGLDTKVVGKDAVAGNSEGPSIAPALALSYCLWVYP